MGDQIRERVRDAQFLWANQRRESALLLGAQFLWANQRRESALLLALVAVAAVARDRHPEAGDREAFVRVLTDALSVRLGVEFRSQLEPIEKLLYKWVRCELVHRGGLPLDLEIADALGEGSWSAREARLSTRSCSHPGGSPTSWGSRSATRAVGNDAPFGTREWYPRRERQPLNEARNTKAPRRRGF